MLKGRFIRHAGIAPGTGPHWQATALAVWVSLFFVGSLAAQPATPTPIRPARSAAIPQSQGDHSPVAAQVEGTNPAPSPEPALTTPIPLSLPSQPHFIGGSPLAANLSIDLPIVLGLGSALLGMTISDPQLPPPSCSPLCDAQTVNELDRVSIGWHSKPARTASDILLGMNLVLPVMLDLIDVAASRPPDALRGYLQDLLILSEVFVVNSGINGLFKYAVRRPRPFLYDTDMDAFSLSDRQDVDSGLSFYSGHSSSAFAMATAGSYLFTLRHPRSKWVIPIWIFSEALAATTASMRVLAGKHFITDVLVGAVMGSAVGLLIPYLHRRALPAALAQRAGRFGQDLRISAAPMLALDGGGLILSFSSTR